ncbi:MAG: Ricin lectin [Actinomycetia bacterium]|nr:Ricin lectin [Actinomycetes bacterium]
MSVRRAAVIGGIVIIIAGLAAAAGLMVTGALASAAKLPSSCPSASSSALAAAAAGSSGASSAGSSGEAAVTPLPGAASGLDISDGNAEPAWSTLKRSGVSFAAIKATEGDYYVNTATSNPTQPGYAGEAKDATAAGLYVMPYVFANPYQGDAARQITGNGSGTCQADYAWQEIGSVTSPKYATSSRMLPIALDIEQDPYAGGSAEPNADECYGLSTSAMVTWIGQFLTEAEKDTGKAPIVYMDPGFWTSCTGNATSFTLNGTTTPFSDYPLWIANWAVTTPKYPAAWRSPTFWQYCAGGIPVADGGCPNSSADLDYLTPLEQSSAVGTAVKPVQVTSLSALNGQAVTYSAPSGGLPPGLTVSGAGLITGRPTAAGSYQASITATSGSTSSTVSFTWDVAGVIRMAPQASQSVTVGTPVSLQVNATDLSGYPLTYTESGLPPGLSITSSGLISGWPSTAGIYSVKITAKDGHDATATASFTWTVVAAADSGTTGSIHQQGGSDKCLDDPSGTTTGVTAIDLATCTGKSNQSWTLAQDGSIRVLGRCLAASGSHVLLYACDGSIADQWRAGTDGALVSARYANTCLNGPSGAAANGTKPTLAACTASAREVNQHWTRPAEPIVSGVTAKCLGASGSTAEINNCGDYSAQHWLIAANAQFAVQSSNCLTEGGTTAGSAITIAKCANYASQHWKLVTAGVIADEIESTASGLCVTVPSATSGAGTRLILGTCSATALTSTWRAA